MTDDSKIKTNEELIELVKKLQQKTEQLQQKVSELENVLIPKAPSLPPPPNQKTSPKLVINRAVQSAGKRNAQKPQDPRENPDLMAELRKKLTERKPLGEIGNSSQILQQSSHNNLKTGERTHGSDDSADKENPVPPKIINTGVRNAGLKSVGGRKLW